MKTNDAPYRIWGEHLEPDAVQQMKNACGLPVAVAGALMPDAHVGYGLPIGGVLATDNAVIPYAVGVDIACRMKMTVLDCRWRALARRSAAADRRRIERETRFGIGAAFKTPRSTTCWMRTGASRRSRHRLKDRAWSQLGTSGSGNHFVEFGTLTVSDDAMSAWPRGEYLALLTHSGSRGHRRAGRAALLQARAATAPGAAAGARSTSRGSISTPRQARNTGRRWS